MAISRHKESHSQPILYSYRITSRVLYSAQYHRQQCTLQAFEKIGAQTYMYMHNLDDEPLTRPRCKPSTSAFRATTGPNEPSGLEILYCRQLASPTECVLIKNTINWDTSLYIPLPGPLRGPAGTLPMCWRCRPISLTPYGRVP